MRPFVLVIAVVMVALPRPALADIDLFAPGRTFAEPVADPRWPRFAATWQEYVDNDRLDSTAAVALGGTIAILRETPADELAAPGWELGLQTAVFGTFQPLNSSQDLFNSDWNFGFYGARRVGDWSGILRLWHQSSHLGDEFLLRNPGIRRINFAFESVSGLAAWEPVDWSRLYGGGGWIFDEIPSDFGNWYIQYGLELRSPVRLFNDYATPFAAVDVQHYEATDWRPDVSLVAGLELQDPGRDGMLLRLILEFYDGRNVNGQFFSEDSQYVGGGLQLRF